MQLSAHPSVHLTYCLNIHPGESWDKNFRAIRDFSLPIRDRVAPGRTFGLGLRLSNAAAVELRRPENLQTFRDFLHRHNLYVFTVNGFPFGTFHGKPVKTDVYRPDWRSSDRLAYTTVLAEVLAGLLPDSVQGSISTVPGSYGPWVRSDNDLTAMVANLADCARLLDLLRDHTGKTVQLALEPEPDCFLETTDQTVEFFTGPLMTLGTAHLHHHHGLSPARAEEVLRQHLSVCLDVCHLAVQFEDPSDSLDRFSRAGVKVGKVQLSSALRLRPSPEARARLIEFLDPVYLHQVKVRSAAGAVRSFPDLADALASQSSPNDEWRIHFHVPLFFQSDGPLESTASLLSDDFFRTLRVGAAGHIEIETYTFSVLPASLRSADVVENVSREYAWTLDRLSS